MTGYVVPPRGGDAGAGIEGRMLAVMTLGLIAEDGAIVFDRADAALAGMHDGLPDWKEGDTKPIGTAVTIEDAKIGVLVSSRSLAVAQVRPGVQHQVRRFFGLQGVDDAGLIAPDQGVVKVVVRPFTSAHPAPGRRLDSLRW